MPIKKGIFITGTDTGVGKTIVIAALGLLLREKGLNVGVMKPVQCAGNDSALLKKILQLKDPLSLINPFFAKEPLSPHLAFRWEKKEINIDKIIRCYKKFQDKHDIVLVEGAGGLCVPLSKGYFVYDLIADLDLDVLVVSRLGLGTINHTLLTINESKNRGLRPCGIIFSASKKVKSGIPEKTNPKIIEELSGVPVLGTIPYLSKINRREILKKCSKVDLKVLLELPPRKEKKWEADDKKYIWHPFTQMKDWLNEEPLVIEEAKGCYLKDANGKWYLDGVSSLWVNVHGHRHKVMDQALKEQINKVSHSTFLGLSNVPAIELAEKLIEIAPKGLVKVFYSDNGSTAVEVAIKQAYQYWQNIGKTKKRNIIHLENSYHGDTLGSVSVGGINVFHKVYRDLIFETISIPSPQFPDGKNCLEPLEKILKESHASAAALVIEPLIQAAAGMLVWPKGVLKKIAALCKKYDVFLIVDEVATGFGRTGKMFACDHEDVSPDFLCLAKGLTGGYLPLAVTLTNKRVFDGFLFDYKDQKTFFHGHTYTANPLACSAALANLAIFRKEETLKKLQPKINFMAKGLKKFYNLPHVADIRQCGFMAGIELTPYPLEKKIGIKVCQEVRKHGLILRPLGNVIVLMPPLAIGISDLEKMFEITYQAIKRIAEEI